MEVASQVVVMNLGRVEQIGAPREVYESPATAFVMSFVGPVNQLDGQYVRPHDLEIHHEPWGAKREAMIERLVHLGFEVRVELLLASGERLWAQVSRDSAEELELESGQIVYLRLSRARTFPPPAAVRD